MNNKTESQNRADIIEVCRRIYRNGWVAANDGNVSIKMDSSTVLCTPTGMSKGFLTTDQLIKVDMQGNKLEGELKPSSEIKMHIDIYKNRDDVSSVVHAHPPFATGFAVAGLALDQCIIPEIIFSIGSIPLTRYGTPSTYEIPENVRHYLKDHNVFLLENHGALSIGPDVYKAYYRMESLELFAKITLIARLLGNVNILGEDEVKKILRIRKEWGFDSNYPGCRVNGKFVMDDNEDDDKLSNSSGGSKESLENKYDIGTDKKNEDDTITMSKEELIKLISSVVCRVLSKGY